MTRRLCIVLTIAIGALTANATTFDSNWVPAGPEVSTYRTIGDEGKEIYQVAILKDKASIETYINIATPGFMKIISGSMTLDMVPLRSNGRILVDGQVEIATDTQYDGKKVHVVTVMKPTNQTMQADVAYSAQIVDFAQMPFLLRMLPLQKDAQFEFASLNPRSNAMGSLKAKVTGEGQVLNVDSYRVQCDDFEGATIYWVEKAAHHRILRIEQPAQHRTLELIL